MARIIVLGAGMVGRAIAIDLSSAHAVTSADRSADALAALSTAHPIATVKADLSDASGIAGLVVGFDLVVCAVPGFMGFETLKAVIDAGKDVMDISFFPENALDLDAQAKEKGVTALVDIGVAPGMDNIILGHHDAAMTVTSFECLVGGLPLRRTWPFEYKAPFSPVDVIEEYTRPARYVENGHIVVKPALSDAELLDFEGVGTLESFNTDGLRSLLFTMPHIPNMKEKTLRYPGHIRLIQALQASGFFSREPLTVGDTAVLPLDFTSKILFDAWTLGPDEAERTVMRVTVTGTEDGTAKTYVYHLYDEYDPATGLSSMARTTGFTCTAAANLFLDGRFSEHGVFPPEIIGSRPGNLAYVLDYLRDRKVVYRREVAKG